MRGLSLASRQKNYQEVDNPWLPREGEASHQKKVEMLVERTPMTMKPKLMQARHHALKEDMQGQMIRVARGLEAERPFISYFKAVALNKGVSPLQSREQNCARGGCEGAGQ